MRYPRASHNPIGRPEGGANREGTEEPDAVAEKLRHEVDEDFVDESGLEALLDDVCPEHEQVAAVGSRQRGRDGVPDIT